MANFPLVKLNKEGTLFHAQHSYYTEEYLKGTCDLYLSDILEKDEQGNLHKYYRLHAKKDHTIEMALAYDIFCPKCKSNKLKQIGRQLSSTELGLYKCPICDKR